MVGVGGEIMPKETTPEEIKAAQQVAEGVAKKIKKEEEESPAELLVQKYPFDPISENEREIKELQKENAGLRETIRELEEDFDKRVRKVEEDVEDFGKIIEKENPE